MWQWVVDTITFGYTKRRRVEREAQAARLTLNAMRAGLVKLRPKAGDTPAMTRMKTMQAIKVLTKAAGAK